MPERVTFRINTREFDEALERYMEVTRRSLADVLNKKALYIARGALRLTPMTEAGAIRSSLGQIIRRKNSITIKPVKAGAVYSNLDRRQSEAPLAALIINARRGRNNIPGLYGPEMEAAIRQLIGARNRSRAFLKSGWIPAIRDLSPLVKDSFGMQGANGQPVQVGKPHGKAIPAHPGLVVKAIIENTASEKHETHEALHKYGGPALQQAFNDEAASMQSEVNKRLYEAARKVGIKAFGA